MPKERFIFIGGKRIPVDEELYCAFMRPVWAEKKRTEIRKDNEISLDALIENGFDPHSSVCLVEQIIEDKTLLEVLLAALQELTDDEREIIDAIFYQEKSERMLASELQVTHRTISVRKNMMLTNLKYFFEKS